MSEPCKDCGRNHPKAPILPGGLLSKLFGQGGPALVPIALLGPPPNPNTAFLRKPLLTKSRPLTTDELKARFRVEYKRAHHKACRFLVEPDVFLDYVSCGKCNVALGADDVFWKSVYGPKRKKLKRGI